MAEIDSSAYIHPTADVEDGATVGARTRVWANAHIRRGASIGADCVIGEGTLVDLDVPLGDRCKVQAHALVFHGSVVSDDVFIGPAACLTNDRNPRASTPGGGPKSDSDWMVSGVRVEQGASIGASSVIVAGCMIGRFAMVGAGAVVTKSVSSNMLVLGNPARPAGWVCVCGHRLGEAFRCESCGRAYILDGQSLSSR